MASKLFNVQSHDPPEDAMLLLRAVCPPYRVTNYSSLREFGGIGNRYLSMTFFNTMCDFERVPSDEFTPMTTVFCMHDIFGSECFICLDKQGISTIGFWDINLDGFSMMLFDALVEPERGDYTEYSTTNNQITQYIISSTVVPLQNWI